MQFMNILQNNPGLAELEALRRWVKQTNPQVIDNFVNFDGLKLLINILETSEIESRESHNYMK